MSKATETIKARLEYLRGELRAEQISIQEIWELQSLAQHIAPDDVELLEAAGVPEHTGIETNFTAGPWQSYNSEQQRIFKTWRVQSAAGRPICTLANLNDDDRHNANLIAAAPDLLLALETLLFNALHGNGLSALQEGHDKARAALQKAKGAQ